MTGWERTLRCLTAIRSRLWAAVRSGQLLFMALHLEAGVLLRKIHARQRMDTKHNPGLEALFYIVLTVWQCCCWVVLTAQCYELCGGYFKFFPLSYVGNMVTACGRWKIQTKKKNCVPGILKEERVTGFKNKERATPVKPQIKSTSSHWGWAQWSEQWISNFRMRL